MQWNWQHPDWPYFQWDTGDIDVLESRFLHESGVASGALKHVAEDEKSDL